MKYFFLCCIMLLSGSQGSLAQKILRQDSSRISSRAFMSAAINQYKSDPVFRYDRTVEPVKSLWTKIWDYVWQKINDMLSSEVGRRTITIVIVSVSAIILVYFILRLSGMTVGGLFGKNNPGERLGYSVEDNDIHGIPFEKVIQDAVSRGDYRGAVRLLYLQTLKLLSDAQLIDWKINKTNIAYVHELPEHNNKNDFRTLTVQFENNWYGDMRIAEHEFMDVWALFKKFNAKIPIH